MRTSLATQLERARIGRLHEHADQDDLIGGEGIDLLRLQSFHGLVSVCYFDDLGLDRVSSQICLEGRTATSFP